jgi:hypothetical protein
MKTPNFRGLIQVGVGEASPRKNKSSESVRAARWPGPADLQFVHKCRNVTHLSIYYCLIPVSQKAIVFFTQVWSIAVVFLILPEILSSCNFFHLHSSKCRYPTFIPLYFFISARPSRRHGSKKVRPYFISGYPL